MDRQEVCYTREVALEVAVEMETESFEAYKKAYFKVGDPLTKDLLRDLALDELRHRYTLEKAFFEDSVLLHDSGSEVGPTMRLSMLLEQKPLEKSATVQDVMIHAIHDEKRAVDFYRGMSEQCASAPMEEMFKKLFEDEEGHLARLEESYERQYMQDM